MKHKKTAMDQLEKIFFKVTKESAAYHMKDEMQFAKNRTHFIISHTPTGPLVVNSCSKNYELIPNRELFTPIVKHLESKYDLEVHVAHSGYSKFYVDFIMKGHGIEIQKKDTIFPKLRINNSYDGYLKYSFNFGFYRLVCENGMTVPVKGTERSLKMMHTPAAGNNEALSKTMGAVETFVDKAQELSKVYKPLISARINSVADAAIRIADAAKASDYPAKQVEAATGRLQAEINMGYKLTDFLIYNAMNHALYHSESKQKDHHKDRTDLKVINYLLTSQ